MESGTEPHQDCLSIREVKGRFERSQETRRDDVFVDEVGEAHHAVFPSCRVDQSIIRRRQKATATGKKRKSQLNVSLDVLTPQFDQFGKDDEAGFLSDGVGEIHSSLDDGEHDSLDVFCSWTNKHST